MKNEKYNSVYDVCIIGGGPAGLACLSSIQEPYSLDLLTDNQIIRASAWIQRNPQSKHKKVCVIDPNPDWFHQWEHNFQTLDISFLRSPTVAHCSYFDRNALLAYAVSKGREDELLETGCSSVKSLRGTIMPQVGLWKLPSSKLFLDFSRNLATTLTHDYIQGKAIDIRLVVNNSVLTVDNSSNIYRIILENQTDVYASAVIVAAGMSGKPIIPESLLKNYYTNGNNLAKQRVYEWKELDNILPMFERTKNGILVIGGGLTAVQAGQKIARHIERKSKGSKVVLCSRRPMVERHFDIPVKWFDEREAKLLQAGFYHESEDLRLEKLKSARGGGSIPPLYMNLNRQMEQSGHLQTVVGDVQINDTDEDGSLIVSISSKKKTTIMKFDAIVLACGVKPDCLSNPFIQNIHNQWPIKIKDGYPCLSEDLQWTEGIYLVGGLASLSVGPDGGNLMGIARAAETVAIALDSKSWLRHQESSVLKNPYDILLEESDLSSCSEDDED